VTDERGASSHLADIGRNLWSNLPALVVSSCAVCVAGVVVCIVTPGVTPLSALLWGLVVGPAFCALLGQVVQLASGEEVPVWSYWRYLRATWRLGLSAWAVPALSSCAFLVSVAFWLDAHDSLALLSMAAGGIVAVLSSVAALVSVPLGLQLPSLRGWPLVLLALHVVARRPIPLLGALSVVVIILWGAFQLSASLVLLLPGPFAVVLVAASLTSAESNPMWIGALEAEV
jgi:hypothetical protein